MDQAVVDRVANDLFLAPHQPDHLSYAAFLADTIHQYQWLIASGFRFSLHGDGSQPYANSTAMFSDLETNRHLLVFTGGSPLAPNHPLEPVVPGIGLSGNTLFRAVHDILGHFPGRYPFESFEGELAAYSNHMRYYSLESQSALYSETVAQLCWYYSKGSYVPVRKCAILPIYRPNSFL